MHKYMEKKKKKDAQNACVIHTFVHTVYSYFFSSSALIIIIAVHHKPYAANAHIAL